MKKLQLSTRVYDRILKVAQAGAGLAGERKLKLNT